MNTQTNSSVIARWCLSLLLFIAYIPLSYAFDASDSEDRALVKYFKENLEKANSGDAQAMYKVGQLFERGRGIQKDASTATYWYERATQAGNHSAQARLGIMYYEGIGFARDSDKAFQLIEAAAKASTPEAEYYLGVMYENGDAITASRKQAIRWYKKALEHGSYRAKSRLRAIDKGYIKVRKKRPQSTSKTSSKVNLAAALQEAILSGNWHRGDETASFLPSSITRCFSMGKNKIRCSSEKQQRKTGDAVITYVTNSTLWGFNSKDEFKVKYQNNVLSNAEQGETLIAEDDEGDYAIAVQSVKPGIGLGQQRTIHKLQCEMKQANKLVCLKNRSQQLTYTNKQ